MNNEPAFPIADPFAVKGPKTEAEALRLQQGMYLRDYFAAKALQGWLASYPDDTDAEKVMPYIGGIARFSYSMADAMLKAREQQ